MVYKRSFKKPINKEFVLRVVFSPVSSGRTGLGPDSCAYQLFVLVFFLCIFLFWSRGIDQLDEHTQLFITR